MLLVVGVAFVGLTIEALLGVKRVAGVVPYVAEIINGKLVGLAVALGQNVALIGRVAQFDEAYTGFGKLFFHQFTILVSHLDDDAGIFSEERLDQVSLLETVEIDLQAAVHIGEAHFEQAGNETAGGNVMTGQQQTFPD